MQTFGVQNGGERIGKIGGRATFVFAAVVLVVGLLGVTPAHANGFGAWIVADISGDVAVRSGDTAWRRISQGQQLVPGTTLKTGADGRATIVRNGDSIKVSPISVVSLPVGKSGAGTPGVVQSLGTLLYKILTREQKQAKFNVKTPYLAAVIKGTTFTVTVNDQGSALHVTEGVVQVTSPFTGEVALIKPGQTGMVSATGGRGLKVLTGKRKRSSADPDSATKGNAAARSRNPESADDETGRGRKIGKRLGRNRIDLSEVTDGLVEDSASPGSQGKAGSNGKAKGLSNASIPGISSGTVAVAGAPAGNGNGNGNGNGGPSPNGVAVGLTGAQPPGLALGLNKNGNNGKGKGKGKKK